MRRNREWSSECTQVDEECTQYFWPHAALCCDELKGEKKLCIVK